MFSVQVKLVLADGHSPDTAGEMSRGCDPRVDSDADRSGTILADRIPVK